MMRAGRAAEAAGYLAEAAELYKARGDARASAVWLEWIQAMLAGDDPNAIKVLAKQEDDKMFSRAYGLLHEKVQQLLDEEKWSVAAAFARQTQLQLPDRLAANDKQAIQLALDKALAGQRQADKLTVARLAPQLAMFTK